MNKAIRIVLDIDTLKASYNALKARNITLREEYHKAYNTHQQKMDSSSLRFYHIAKRLFEANEAAMNEINDRLFSRDNLLIENLDLSERALIVLKKLNITTLSQLLDTPTSVFASTLGCGKMTIKELNEQLSLLGFSLND